MMKHNFPNEATMATNETLKQQASQTAVRRRGAGVYDGLLWRIQPMLDDRHGVAFLLGITACDRRAGVSTLAANLAFRAADLGLGPVLLVDANGNHPRLSNKFRLRKAMGLTGLLQDQCQESDAIYETHTEGLSLLPFGSLEGMDRFGIEAQHIEGVLNSLRESYGLIVFDLPSINELPQTLPLVRLLDGTLLAVRSGSTSKKNALQAANRLRSDRVNLIGSVLTHHREHVPAWLRRRF